MKLRGPVLLLLALRGGHALAGSDEPFPRIDVHAELQSAALARNDSDFDRTPPAYNPQGQSVGLVGSLFRPWVEFQSAPTLRLHYDAEVGLNYWSKLNPDPQAARVSKVFLMKHRQLYGEGEFLGGEVGFRVGYGRFIGPTGLFLNHWVGHGQASWAPTGRGSYTVFAGRLGSDDVEGIELKSTPLSQDMSFFGLRGVFELSGSSRLEAAVEAVHDAHARERTRLIATPSLRLEGQLGRVRGFAAAALQVGRLQGETLAGDAATLIAWAVQAQGTVRGRGLEVTGNVLALSPDDDFDGNARASAFLYSGKSSSATVMLTEDELLDWRDNLDERLSARRAGFWENRAGLAVADVKVVYAAERFRPGFVLGVATALNPRNTLGGAFVGAEADALLEARVGDRLVGQFLVGTLIPGSAASALANRIDLRHMEPLLSAEASLTLRY